MFIHFNSAGRMDQMLNTFYHLGKFRYQTYVMFLFPEKCLGKSIFSEKSTKYASHHKYFCTYTAAVTFLISLEYLYVLLKVAPAPKLKNR